MKILFFHTEQERKYKHMISFQHTFPVINRYLRRASQRRAVSAAVRWWCAAARETYRRHQRHRRPSPFMAGPYFPWYCASFIYIILFCLINRFFHCSVYTVEKTEQILFVSTTSCSITLFKFIFLEKIIL